MNLSTHKTENNDFISLSDFFKTVFLYKKLLISSVICFAVLSVIYSLSLPNKYTSTVSLEVKLGQDKQPSSMASGGLSSLIGISSDNQKSALLRSMIMSKSFAKNLIKHEGVSESIIAAETFDITSGEIIFDKNLYDVLEKKWVREVSYPFKTNPSYLELHDVYSSSLKIYIDESSGLMDISFEHVSPFFSKYFIDLIVLEANKFMQNRDFEESKNALEYLNQQILQSSQLEVRKAIGSLVEDQLKKQMISNVSDEYALSVISPSFVPELKSSPNRSFVCILGTFIGFILTMFSILMHDLFFRKK